MVRSFVAVGSNLGDRFQNIQTAKTFLEQNPSVKVLQISSIYETEPVGGPPQGKYLNAVLEIETDLLPEALMRALLKIESALGRERIEPNSPRTLDLDILFYGHEIIREPGLVIPHPRLHERYFVLEPLAELAPDFIHPVIQKNIRALLEELHESHPKT